MYIKSILYFISNIKHIWKWGELTKLLDFVQCFVYTRRLPIMTYLNCS